jgi:hypothetical protein
MKMWRLLRRSLREMKLRLTKVRRNKPIYGVMSYDWLLQKDRFKND